jgi:hypothetical protein
MDMEYLWFGLLASPYIAMLMFFSHRGIRYKKKLSLSSDGLDVTIPAAGETSESILRFRETAERFLMVEFAWDRYSKGRGLLMDDIRRATLRKSRKAVSQTNPIPKWL